MARSVTDQLKERLKPTPFSQLSGPRKLRRAFGFLLAISAGAMAVSAQTADSDWDIRADGSKGAKEAIEAQKAEKSGHVDQSDTAEKSEQTDQSDTAEKSDDTEKSDNSAESEGSKEATA